VTKYSAVSGKALIAVLKRIGLTKSGLKVAIVSSSTQMEERQLYPFIQMKLWGLDSWQASFVMSSSQELDCKTFYDDPNGCPTSRFSGRAQRCLINALGWFPPLILSVGRAGAATQTLTTQNSITHQRERKRRDINT
jgi:hypothetical protein